MSEQLNSIVKWRLQQLELNAEQYKAVTLPKGNIVVSAAAGSGKTYTMTERIMCRVLAKETTLAKLLILTFTEKASENMQTALLDKIAQIRQAFLEMPLSERESLGLDVCQTAETTLSQATSELAFAQISTIHAFCKQLIADAADLADGGIALQANEIKQAKIADEKVSDTLLEQACQRVLDYVLQVINTNAMLDWGQFSQNLTNILPDELSETTFTEQANNEFKQLCLQMNLQGEKFKQTWLLLLAQLRATKDLTNLISVLKSTYKQFRSYPDYMQKLEDAAVYAYKRAENLQLAPEYSYFLKELEQAFTYFNVKADYLRTHLPGACFVKKAASPDEKTEVTNYLIYLISEIQSHLAPLLAQFNSLANVKQRFSKGERAAVDLELEPDTQVYDIYKQVVAFGQSLAVPPELADKKGSKPFKFNARTAADATETLLREQYIKFVGPILQLIAPQIKIISQTEINKFSNIQPNLLNFDLGQETYLAKEQQQKNMLWVELLLALDGAYANLKKEKQVADFSDLEQTAYTLLKTKKVSDYCKEHYQEIYVDEYQDTSNIQEAILQKLAKDNLFVVGDIKQSIYAFRNAKLANFQSKVNLAKQIGSTATDSPIWTLVNFNTNYRSLPGILTFCNEIFQALFQPELFSFDYIKDAHYFQAAPKFAKQKLAPEPVVKITSCKSDIAPDNIDELQTLLASELSDKDALLSADLNAKTCEPYLIASEIKQILSEPTQLEGKSIAVLARSHSTLAKVAQALAESKLPYTLAKGKNDDTEQTTSAPTVAALELYFLVKALTNASDDETITSYLTATYVLAPLSLAEIAEIKAALEDYSQFALKHASSLSEEQVSLLKNLHYLPYHQVLDLYLAAIQFKASKLSEFLAEQIPDFLVDYAKFTQPELASKLELDLEQLYRWQDLFNELGFNAAWQTIFSEIKLKQLALNSDMLAEQASALLALRRLVKQTNKLYTYPTLANLLTAMPTASALMLEADMPKLGTSVNLLTFHAAKGLEFDYVFIAGLDYQLKFRTNEINYADTLGFVLKDSVANGLVQYVSMSELALKIAEREAIYAEELRLLYVAFSRAKAKLYLYVNELTNNLASAEARNGASDDACATTMTLAGNGAGYKVDDGANALLGERANYGADDSASAGAGYRASKLQLAEIYQAKTYADLLNLAWQFRTYNVSLNSKNGASYYELENLTSEAWLLTLAKIYLPLAKYTNIADKYAQIKLEANAETTDEEAKEENKEEVENLTAEYRDLVLKEPNVLKQAKLLSETAICKVDNKRNLGEKQAETPLYWDITTQTILATQVKNLLANLNKLKANDLKAARPNSMLASSLAGTDLSAGLPEPERLQLQVNANRLVEVELASALTPYNTKYSVSEIKHLVAPKAKLTKLKQADAKKPKSEPAETENLPLSAAKSAKIVTEFANLCDSASTMLNSPSMKQAAQIAELTFTATDRGTLIHRFLQFVDLNSLATLIYEQGNGGKNAVQSLISLLTKQLDNLVDSNIIPRAAKELVLDVMPKLAAIYLESAETGQFKPLYEDLAIALQKETKAIYREFPFVMQWPLVKFVDYFPELISKELADQLHNMDQAQGLDLEISVQGVIDLWWRTDKEIYLVDYKTDILSKAAQTDRANLEKFFLNHYKVPMQLYALALKQGLNLSEEEVKVHLHVYIYSVQAGTYVELKLW